MKKVQLFAAAVVAVAMTACAAPSEEAEVTEPEVTEEVVAEEATEEVAEEADTTAEEATEEVTEEAAADEHEGHDPLGSHLALKAQKKSHYCSAVMGFLILTWLLQYAPLLSKPRRRFGVHFYMHRNPKCFWRKLLLREI